MANFSRPAAIYKFFKVLDRPFESFSVVARAPR
jgi:hypothetical protein